MIQRGYVNKISEHDNGVAVYQCTKPLKIKHKKWPSSNRVDLITGTARQPEQRFLPSSADGLARSVPDLTARPDNFCIGGMRYCAARIIES